MKTNKRKVLPAAFSCVLLSGLMSAVANAAVYDLFLWDGPDVGEGTPLFLPTNNSRVEIAESITWDLLGISGTSGTFNIVNIQVDVGGTLYQLSDAIAPATATWSNGKLVDLNYETVDFSVSVKDANVKEWSGFLVPATPVPLPGAAVLFASALGLLGFRVSRK